MRSSKTTKPTRPLTEEEARLRLKKQNRALKTQQRAQNWLALLLITFSLLVPFTSPYWRVRHVVITGVQGNFTPAEAETLQQTLTTSKYTNWLRAPVGTLYVNALKLPTVDSIRISRQWGWKLIANVVPRTPYAILSTNGAKYEMDVKGNLIRPARETLLSQLPQIELPNLPNVQLGQQIGTFSCTSWLYLLQNRYANSTVRIEKIVVDSYGNLCLNMSDKLEVRLGQYIPLTNLPTDSFAYKLDRLKVMYQHRPAIANEIAVVNLSAPQYPACIPRNATATPSVPIIPESSSPSSG